ncbi:hypothetical protein CPB83DRAFT_848855 [Crepidotus variabilis]|uniref:Uncharacterized protein n=1 Tax=Crepidotus variabilis TaxID=179855 RepID=A0A9P6JRX7_9AGAR|nr:hypothetical protein CPB83DRAFT_848855 [Crepidotus variabilis]
METVLQHVQVDLTHLKRSAEQTYPALQRLLALSAEQRMEVHRMSQDVQQLLHHQSTSPVDHIRQKSFPRPSKSQTLDFLNHQLLNIEVEVLKRTTPKNPSFPRQPTKTFIQHIPMISFQKSSEKRHRALLERVLSLLRGLEESDTPVDEHAYALNALGDIFCNLAMFREASTVYTWAVKLYRILTELQPEEFKPYLAESLCNLAWPLKELQENPSAIIEEGIALLRLTSDFSSRPDVRCQFALQLAAKHRFLGSARIQESAVEDFSEAINIVESILKEDARFIELFGLLNDNTAYHLSERLLSHFSAPHTLATVVHRPSNDFELIGYDAFLLHYAYLLEGASEANRDRGSISTSENFLLKAAIASSYLAATYPNTALEVILARRLTYLLQDFIPIMRQLKYADVSLRILRRASIYDPTMYTGDKFLLLAQKAQILQKLDRREEAREIWGEVAELDASLIQDQVGLAYAFELASNNLRLLDRREEAISLRTKSAEIYHHHFKELSSQEAYAHCALAYDYQLAGRYQDALRAAEVAVEQFQDLSLQKPQEHVDGLVWSISTWGDVLASSWSNNFPFDVDHAKTLFGHCDWLARRDITFLDQYLTTITTLLSKLPTNLAIQLNLDVIARLQYLACIFSKEVTPGLQGRLVQHAKLLSDSLLISTAQHGIEYAPQANTPPLPW